MMAGVHPGLPRIGKSGHDGAGRPRLEPVKCSGAAKAKRRRHHRQARFCPLSCDLLFRAKDLFMAATVSIFPCRGKDEEGVSTPGFDRAGLQSERPKGACPPKNGRTVSDCGAYGIAEHRRAYGRAEKVRTWLRAAARPPAPGSRRAATRPHSGARVSGAQGSTRRIAGRRKSDLRSWSENSHLLRPDPHRFFSNANAKSSE